ncbi:PIN domain nuclease [Patescibacteria group bacterium]|nr:PIN domain nuclease [Patescibacteria group bacterium]MBU1868224.1 PIN domain nuclease [Patescibacteria group bacterium]
MLKKFESIQLSSVLVALGGIVVGLIIGFLFSIPIDKMPYDWTWMVSVGVYMVVVILMVVLFLSKKGVIVETVSRIWSVRFSRGDKEEFSPEYKENQAKSKSKEVNWDKAILLDTSAIIDGRIADIIRTGFVDGELVVPSFILDELQRISDATSLVKRNRGRRGLEILEELKKEEFVGFHVLLHKAVNSQQVDSALVDLASENGARIITTDFNLNKVGKVRGVKVLNVNELANMVKTILVPGERLTVKVIQGGKESTQGVAYLPDGTMIVIEDGKGLVGKKVKVVVERLFQTEAGRMIFVRPV